MGCSSSTAAKEQPKPEEKTQSQEEKKAQPVEENKQEAHASVKENKSDEENKNHLKSEELPPAAIRRSSVGEDENPYAGEEEFAPLKRQTTVVSVVVVVVLFSVSVSPSHSSAVLVLLHSPLPLHSVDRLLLFLTVSSTRLYTHTDGR